MANNNVNRTIKKCEELINSPLNLTEEEFRVEIAYMIKAICIENKVQRKKNKKFNNRVKKVIVSPINKE